MKRRKELKQEAKATLKGNYGKAIALNILPILFTIFIAGGSTYVVNQMEYNVTYTLNLGYGSLLFSTLISGLIATLIIVGINYVLLNWFRSKDSSEVSFKQSFTAVSSKYFKSTFMLYIIQWIFIRLWLMLLVIPAIIKSFSYSQTYYIYKDIKSIGMEENFSYTDYITMSRDLMNGYKTDYFVLQLSFIGWHILAICTFGLLYFWLIPYQQMTMMAFYDDLSGNRFRDPEYVQEWMTKLNK